MDVPAPANRPFPNLVMPHHVSGWKDGLIRFEIAKALHDRRIVPQGDVTVSDVNDDKRTFRITYRQNGSDENVQLTYLDREFVAWEFPKIDNMPQNLSTWEKGGVVRAVADWVHNFENPLTGAKMRINEVTFSSSDRAKFEFTFKFSTEPGKLGFRDAKYWPYEKTFAD